MHKLYLSLLFVLLLAQASPVWAEGPTPLANCGCDYTIPLTQWKTDAATAGIGPGDTVCLPAGTRGNMRLENFAGTPAQPITLKNCGGLALIEGPVSLGYGIAFINSRYFRLTGSGDAGFTYGIKVKGPNLGVTVGGLSTNAEVDHVEIEDIGFAGLMAKTDPTCDPATWRANFTMYDVWLHHNYIHYTHDGEGFYIGYTFYDGVDMTCSGVPTTVYGHIIEGLKLYNNITVDTGAEGIQVSSVPNGAEVYNNQVLLFGQRPFADYQNNGIQLGEGRVKLYNNLVKNGPGNGLIIFGTGHQVFNNVVANAGSYGIFADDRAVGLGHKYLNNTIVSPALDGIRIYVDEATTPNIIKNNLIVNPGSGKYVTKLNNNVQLDMSDNLFEANVSTVKFSNPAANDYQLMWGSPAIDAGTDLSGQGVTLDILGRVRPARNAYDTGAYEFGALPPGVVLTEFVWLPLLVSP